MLWNIDVQCNLEGCKWRGVLQTYANHLMSNCDFAKSVCLNCKEIVCVKDVHVHVESNECKNHHTTEIECPSGCGYKNQRWFMKVHSFDKCPKSKRKCPLEDDNDRDRTERVSREHRRLIVSFNQQCNDTFEMKICQLDFHDEIIMCLQNVIPVELWMTTDCFFDYLNVHIVSCREIHVDSIFETLKQTTVTLTLVNQDKSGPDHETRDFKTIIPFDTSHLDNELFSKLKVIKTENMLSNSETNTCYFHDNGCEIKIDFRYPNKLRNFDFG